ncbi:protein [Escherichia coli]|uniref:Protein n=1 Tax=Escherichia coli TaxID=562 RepID=A0AAX2K863_ECOLX|nr:protein [Escherichia coli]
MIAEFESRILALIDGMVDHASDDELFASGYFAWPPDISHRRTGKW